MYEYGYVRVVEMKRNRILIIVMLMIVVFVLLLTHFVTTVIKQENKKETLQQIYQATEQYILPRQSNYYAGQEAFISIHVLQQEGYLDSDVIHPVTGKPFSKNDYVKVSVNADYTMNFELNGA
jgi:competence protein ComGC